MKKNNFNLICIILIIIGLIYISFLFILEAKINPVSKDINYSTYEIKSNNLKDICKQLEDDNIVRSKTAFYIKSQLSGIAGKFGKGIYELSPSMTSDEIIEVLQTDGIKQENTITVTILEGYTIEDIANTLYENKVIYDKNIFLDLCKNGEKFKENHALTDIEDNENSKYKLEGYLFPDTYEFYENSSSEDVINKMLNKFNEIYDVAYESKMKEYVYNKNDVIILASIIEKEGKQNDFKKISSILHNRLNSNMALQVDASVRYLSNMENTISITSEQYKSDNAYNTYKNQGLPPTAICNPSKSAIEAVLYPNEKFIQDKYLYFCLTDYETGEMVYSKTYEEHLENVKKYKDNWEAYDNAIE